jgi:hypothetical protein
MILIMFLSDLSHVFGWGLLVILHHDIKREVIYQVGKYHILFKINSQLSIFNS